MEFGGTFLNTQKGLPPIKLAESLILNETGPQSTSQMSRPGTILNYLGVPVMDPRRGQLNARGISELQQRFKSASAANELVPVGWES